MQQTLDIMIRMQQKIKTKTSRNILALSHNIKYPCLYTKTKNFYQFPGMSKNNYKIYTR